VWETIQVHFFLINKFGNGVGCDDITNVLVIFGTRVKYARLWGGGSVRHVIDNRL